MLVPKADALEYLQSTLVELNINNDGSQIQEHTPIITSKSSMSASENDTITLSIIATDENKDTLTYSLSGVDANYFTINKDTGVLAFKSPPDYENKSSHLITASVSDGTLSDTQDITVNILDLDESVAPVITSGKSISVNENQLSVLTIEASDKNDDKLIYSLTGVDAGYFNINESTGELTFKELQDFESGVNLYSITLNASDATQTTSQDLSITLLDVLEYVEYEPVITSQSVYNIVENQSLVFTATATDANDDTLTYSLLGPDAGLLDIDENYGIVTLKFGADYESGKVSYSILLSVSDAKASVSQLVTINIINVADIAPILEDTVVNIAENSSAASIVGKLNISSTGDTDITAISLSGAGAENFHAANDGTITVASGVILDFDTIPLYNLIAVAKNQAGASQSINLKITISDVADTVPVLEDSTADIAENISPSSIVGNLNINSIGDTDITAISLSGVGAENFHAANDGTITVASGVILDFDTIPLYDLIAVAKNQAGDSQSINLKITISDVADTVPVLEDSTADIAENISPSSIVGNLNINSIGDTNITAISLSGVGAENFNIANDGTITIAPGVSLDYENKEIYTLEAVATNKAGDSASIPLSINITDVIDTVAILKNTTMSVSEDTNKTILGTLIINSIGDSNITAISLSGDGVENFHVANDGLITVSSGVSLDYETKKVYNLTAIATNKAGKSSSVILIINILNVVDIAPILEDSIVNIKENSKPNSIIDGKLSIKSRGDTNITAIELNGIDASNFNVANDGVITVASGVSLDYETKKIYNLTAVATNEAGESNSVTLDISIDNVREHKILSAVYNNNGTNEDVTDDTLYIYMSESIDESTRNIDESENYDIVGNGSINSTSTSTYIDSHFHQHKLKLTAGSTLFSGDDTILIRANQITDDNGLDSDTTREINATKIEKFRIIFKTGQKSFFDKDDGYYQRGVQSSYTIADNKMTVRDNVTRLIWQSKGDGNKYNWQDAVNYCKGLNLDSNEDWRLPTIYELQQITNKNKAKYAKYPGFINKGQQNYWSSTTAALTFSAWYIDIWAGRSKTVEKNKISTNIKKR